MKSYTRGSTVTVEARDFLDSDGATLTPTTVTFYLDYPVANRSRSQATLTGTNASGVWTADWDSSVSFPGTVFVSAWANSDDTLVKDMQFQLVSNQANPDPT